MSSLTKPLPVLFFTSFLYHHEMHNQDSLTSVWSERFGEPIIFKHPFFPMANYYSREMGDSKLLERFFLFSIVPAKRELLVDHKLWADQFEKKYSSDGKREVNLDPGYVSLENVVLATGKNYSHRVFLQQGVFAELTLIFKQPSFVATPWCYPDYAHPEVIEFFNWYRQFLHLKVKDH